MSRRRFVQALTEESTEQLCEIYHSHIDFAFRKRTHAILLSAWIKRFGGSGIDGLKSLPIPGRPPIYTEDEVCQL
jgi:hypothetical protein